MVTSRCQEHEAHSSRVQSMVVTSQCQEHEAVAHTVSEAVRKQSGWRLVIR